MFVMNVTCHRIQQFSLATNAYITTPWWDTGNTLLYHGIASNFQGTLILQDHGRRFAPTTAPATCAPDSDIPVMTGISAASVTYIRTPTITIGASDRCSGVALMNISGSGLVPTGWVPYSAKTTISLTAGDGIKTVVVKVRDAVGRESGSLQRSIKLDTSQPPLRIRSRVRIAGAARSCKSNPLKYVVGGKRKYKLLDRCVTIRGRVLRVERHGSSIFVQLQLSGTTTKRIFTNARTAQKIWVLGSKRASGARRVRKGRKVKVTAALVKRKKPVEVIVMPAWRWR
jgi:hypothetical protein